MKIKHHLCLCGTLCLLVAAISSCSGSQTTTKRTTTTTTKKTSSSSSSSSTTAKIGAVLSGQASYYADKFVGKSTASGEKYVHNKLTAAHRTLPFGTMLRVTNKANGKSVDVRVNDRGPFKEGRIVDLSKSAAQKIDMIKDGVVNVSVTIISLP